ISIINVRVITGERRKILITCDDDRFEILSCICLTAQCAVDIIFYKLFAIISSNIISVNQTFDQGNLLPEYGRHILTSSLIFFILLLYECGFTSIEGYQEMRGFLIFDYFFKEARVAEDRVRVQSALVAEQRQSVKRPESYAVAVYQN